MQHMLLMISSEAPGDETAVEPARTPTDLEPGATGPPDVSSGCVIEQLQGEANIPADMAGPGARRLCQRDRA